MIEHRTTVRTARRVRDGEPGYRWACDCGQRGAWVRTRGLAEQYGRFHETWERGEVARRARGAS